MALEIRIDRELCMGSGQCVIYASNTFGQDDDAIAVVLDATGDSDAEVKAAATGCPTSAISIVDD